MPHLERVTHDAALAEIPDTPATLEFRAIALDPRSQAYRSGDGLLLVDSCCELACAVGRVSRADVGPLYRSGDLECELLADEQAHAALGEVQGFGPAAILTLGGPFQPALKPVDGLTVRELRADDSLDHVPSGILAEVTRWRTRTDIVCGVIEGVVRCVAYAPWSTETLADISIDTMPYDRQKGIGSHVASALIEQLLRNGRAPVWGAAESNFASLLVARKLDFCRPAGRLWVNSYPRVLREDGAA